MNPIQTIQNILKAKAYSRKTHALNHSKKIILSGTPRGGSTWAYEVLLGEKGIGVWEPLHPVWLKKNGIQPNGNHDLYAPKDLSLPMLQDYLEQILYSGNLDGQNRFYPKKEHSLKRILGSEFIVFKFCRLGPLLPWFFKRFPFCVWHIVRNPYAVVSSQLRHPAWKFIHTQQAYRDNKNSFFPQYYESHYHITNALNHPEELLAAKWCMDLIPILDCEKSDKLYLSCYKELVENGIENFRRAYGFYGLSFDYCNKEQINMPSMTTRKGSNILDGKSPLTTYKKYLSQNQINRIQKVIDSFGLNSWEEIIQKHR
ncbi:MAG: hypothetical protein CMN34_08575 [Saprospirales bacterium]|nr:hypothetical protein [Saprospirales bacterium]|tara:strand:- start:6945 stop:7886 length:942 start_codon:yes stop_codon:yes gene_type:complete